MFFHTNLLQRRKTGFFLSLAICLFANILRFKANINNLPSIFVKNNSNLIIININSICCKACRGCQNSEIYLQYLYIINNIFLKKVILKYKNHRSLFKKINYIILIVDLIRVSSHYSIFNHHWLSSFKRNAFGLYGILLLNIYVGYGNCFTYKWNIKRHLYNINNFLINFSIILPAVFQVFF